MGQGNAMTIIGGKSKTREREPRLFIVTTPTGVRYVRALTQQGAISHVVVTTHKARVAKVDDAIGLDPKLIETAGE